ncbi:hypothetical protein EG68_03093 [Paragonimus skrjabini miyazakii]|uniref:Uncharacterized protein n=1 Tax=Paragonimus skrjabini miyazakii TaxID=59628 RepID=A0A8S9Z2M8_9TREM|nr:hypothetical protein EG68_03093 [Paragonimus skrjabini miyazakii]
MDDELKVENNNGTEKRGLLSEKCYDKDEEYNEHKGLEIAQVNTEDSLLHLLESEFLLCSSCHDNITDVLVSRSMGLHYREQYPLLPCLHVACLQCVSSAERDNQLTFVCQVCLTGRSTRENRSIDAVKCSPSLQVTSNGEDTSQLPVAAFVMGLRNLAQLLENEVERACDYCKFETKITPAECRCVECGDDLCRPCAEAHKRTKLTRFHKLLSYKELAKADCLTRIRQAPPPLCMDHKPLKGDSLDAAVAEHEISPRSVQSATSSDNAPRACAYCRNCDVLLCGECGGQFCTSHSKPTHANHLVIPLETVICEHRTELGQLTSRLYKKRKTYEDYFNHLVTYRQQLTEQTESLAEQIYERARNLHEEIDKTVKCLTKISGDRIQSEISTLDTDMEPFPQFIRQCQVAEHYAKAIKEHGRADEIVQNAEHVIARLTELDRKQLRQLEAKIRPEFHAGENLPVTNEHQDNEDKEQNQAAIVQQLLGRVDFVKELEPTLLSTHSLGIRLNEDNHQGDGYSPISDFVSTGVNTTPRFLWDPSEYRNGAVFDVAALSERSLMVPEDFPTPKAISQRYAADAPSFRLITEIEFDARVPTDSRDVWPTGVAVNQCSGQILVVDRDNARVKVFQPDGHFVSSLGDNLGDSDRLISPFDITIVPTGTILISDYQLEEVRLFSLEGQAKGSLSFEKFKHPRGVCHGMGLVGVVDSRRRQIGFYDMRNDKRTAVRRVPLTYSDNTNDDSHALDLKPMLTEPYFVECLEIGNGYVAVTDWAAPSLKLYSLSTGTCVAMAGGYGTGVDQCLYSVEFHQQMLQPYGLCYAPWMQKILIADHVNHRIQSTHIRLSPELDDCIGQSAFLSARYQSVQQTIGFPCMGPLKPVADKSMNAVWHPLAVAADSHQQRVIVTEALGNVKVLRAGIL